jgi:hypothetical protein
MPDNPKKEMRQANRAQRSNMKEIKTFAKQIKSGALNLDEMSPGMISSNMREAQKLVDSQNYSDRMRGDTETRNQIGIKDFQKKGGMSKSKGAFFNPGMSKPKKK